MEPLLYNGISNLVFIIVVFLPVVCLEEYGYFYISSIYGDISHYRWIYFLVFP